MSKETKKEVLSFGNNVTNEEFVCKDCRFRGHEEVPPLNTGVCIVYPKIKPLKVLGGGTCMAYEKES